MGLRRVAAAAALLVMTALSAIWIVSHEQRRGGGGWFAEAFSSFFPAQRPSVDDCDEAWLTRRRLTGIMGPLIAFNQAAEAKEKGAIRSVTTLDEFWDVVRKVHVPGGLKVPTRSDENYVPFVRDGWGQPFVFEIQVTERASTIRIGTGVGAGDLFVESVVDDGQGNVRRGWD